MWQTILGYFGGFLLIVVLFWRFFRGSQWDKKKEGHSNDLITSLLWIILSVGGYFYSIKNYSNDTILVFFWLAVLVLSLAGISLLGLIGEKYLRFFIDSKLNKIRASEFGKSWMVYKEKANGSILDHDIDDWYNYIIQFSRKELFKKMLFSLIEREGVLLRFLNPLFVFIFLSVVYLGLFIFLPGDSVFNYGWFERPDRIEPKSVYLITFPVMIQLFLCLFLLLLPSLLIISKIWKAYFYWYINTPYAFFFKKAVEYKNIGNREMALMMFKKLRSRLHSNGFSYPKKIEDGFIWVRITPSNIKEEINNLNIEAEGS